MINGVKGSLPAKLKSSTPVILAGLELLAEKIPKAARDVRRKYLISWSLTLDREDLADISRRPEALEKALGYVRSMAKESGLEVYRIVPIEELTRHVRPTADSMASEHPSGIAIAKAGSVEEAGRMIQEWMNGLSYGKERTTPLWTKIEYEIKPLAEVAPGGSV
jgi:hypothetical protein